MTDIERLILEELRELREDVAELRTDVARLQVQEPPRKQGLVRDGGLTISAATLGGAVLWIIQHLAAK